MDMHELKIFLLVYKGKHAAVGIVQECLQQLYFA